MFSTHLVKCYPDPSPTARSFLLLRLKINVLGVSQGASEMNIIVAVARKGYGETVRALFSTFGMQLKGFHSPCPGQHRGHNETLRPPSESGCH